MNTSKSVRTTRLNNQIAQILKSFFGGTSRLALIMSLITLVAFGWFGNATYAALDANRFGSIIAFATFPSLALFFYFRARHAKIDFPLEPVALADRQHTAKGLILSLSYEDSQILNMLSELVNGGMSVDDALERLRDTKTEDNKSCRSKWEISFHAIRMHARSLDAIFILCSHQSAEQLPDFKRLLEIWAAGYNTHIDVYTGTDLGEGNSDGLDFSNLPACHKAVQDAFELLQSRTGAYAREVIVDITSGTKAVSIAGAIASVTGARYMQYIDTTQRGTGDQSNSSCIGTLVVIDIQHASS